METKNGDRKSNFELLRIILIVLILFHHFYWSNFSFDFENINPPQFMVEIFAMWGKIGVNCFILLTGYFLCTSKLKIRKILYLCGEIWLYSLISLVIAYTIGMDISLKQLVKAIFPIIFNEYWFATSYILLYLFCPFLNKIIEKFDNKTYKALLAMLTVIFVFIPTFMYGNLPLSDLGWFIYLYLVGAYIRKNKIMFKNNLKIIKKLAALIIISIISIIILNKIQKYVNINPLHFAMPTKQILPTLQSICIFCIFMNINIDNKTTSKIINKVAASTFGVYLIHSNYFMNIIIFQYIFNVKKYETSPFLFLYEVFVVLITYIACLIIDSFRKATFEKIYIKFINRILKLKMVKDIKLKILNIIERE